MRFLSVVALGVVFHACASYTDDTREIRSDFRSGRFDSALKTLEESSLKESKRNRFLYLAEKAMILDRKGERKDSRALLKQAEEVADQLYTVSITNTAASLVVNEAATDYGGEDYERVAVHLMMALSFLEDGDNESALVEARKINTKLEQINAAYGEKNKNKYGEDAFARYLAALIYDSKGQWDSAIIDYTRALALYEGGYDRFINGDTPDELIKRLYALLRFRGRSERLKAFRDRFPKLTAEVDQDLKQDGGYLAVVHELGQIANKETVEFPIQISNQLVRLSFPTIAPGRSNFSKTGLTVNGKFSDAANAQDMNDIARTTLEDRRLRLIAKQGVRLLAKGQLTEQAYRNFGPVGGILANVFSVVTETADTRSWSLLPAAFDVSHVRLAPGKYKVEIFSDGKLQDVRDVTIVKDQTVLMRARGDNP